MSSQPRLWIHLSQGWFLSIYQFMFTVSRPNNNVDLARSCWQLIVCSTHPKILFFNRVSNQNTLCTLYEHYQVPTSYQNGIESNSFIFIDLFFFRGFFPVKNFRSKYINLFIKLSYIINYFEIVRSMITLHHTYIDMPVYWNFNANQLISIYYLTHS